METMNPGISSILRMLICSLVVIFPCGKVGADALGTAFPGADGFGSSATGWQNGKIQLVTTLDDEGPGSFRDCAQGVENRKLPRVCVFSVGGTIELQSPVYVSSNVYIAGQTAPGDGIQLRIVGGKHSPIILKNVHDVVIRFLKVRPGPSVEESSTVDALTIENAKRVFLGNLSLAFATDETFSIHVSGSTASDITLADSIIALSLDGSNHPKGRHSKGALICSDEGQGNQCGRISLIRNLFAHHRDRMPDIKGTDIGPIEVINNVFYNPISQFGEFYDLIGNARITYWGNVALAGPSTKRAPEAVQVFEREQQFSVTIFANDNLAGTAEGCRKKVIEVFDSNAEKARVSFPGWPLTLEPLPASRVLSFVLETAGDLILGRRDRDSLDQKVVEDVKVCGGSVIDHVNEVGGWPTMRAIQAGRVRDSDGDGLPDEWEATSNELDPNAPDDPWLLNSETGLTHLETWLAVLANDIEPLEAAK